MTNPKLKVVSDFIDLVIENYNNGGRLPKPKEEEYHDLKQQIAKALELTTSPTDDSDKCGYCGKSKNKLELWDDELFNNHIHHCKKELGDGVWIQELVEGKRNLEKELSQLRPIMQALKDAPIICWCLKCNTRGIPKEVNFECGNCNTKNPSDLLYYKEFVRDGKSILASQKD